MEKKVTTNKLSQFGIDIKPRYLVLDVSNLLYRSFYANKNEDDMTTAGMAHHQALALLNKYYKQHKPDKVFMAFDRSNWRKVYTQSDVCYSKRIYKGHRRQKLTPAEQAKYTKFCEHLTDFEKIMTEYTSVICLAAAGVDGRGLEADDLIAGVVQKYHSTHEIIIVSADKDLMQLLRFPSVTLMDPATDKNRTLDEYNNDADYFMFEKCLRGDMGDNVGSAFPRIRSTRIELAYKDPYEREQVLQSTWINENSEERLVKTIFNENKLLMDLTMQPADIKELMNKTIDEAVANPGKFSHFQFLRFCGKYQLKKVSEQIEQYVPMLSVIH